jgi:anti-sigma factor RsiW
MTDVRHLDEEQVQSFLEGLLPGGERARVDAHLESCPACQSLLVSFETLEEALSGLPLADPPADFTAGVMARIDEREKAKAGERRVVVAVLATVSAALVVAVLLAGQAAWAPALSAVSSMGVSALRTARIASDVMSPVITALRVEIIVALAVVGIPLLLALSRLSAPRQAQAA